MQNGYNMDIEIRTFIRQCLALPFVQVILCFLAAKAVQYSTVQYSTARYSFKVSDVEPVFEMLTQLNFINPDSPYSQEFKKFHAAFIKYLKKTWVSGPGNFSLPLWNFHKQTRNLTNNKAEAYNSKLNKIIRVPSPNPSELLAKLTSQMQFSELEIRRLKVSCYSLIIGRRPSYSSSLIDKGYFYWQLTYIFGQDCNPSRSRANREYERHVVLRQKLNHDHDKGDLTHLEFLHAMGRLARKGDRKLTRRLRTDDGETVDVPSDHESGSEPDCDGPASESDR